MREIFDPNLPVIDEAPLQTVEQLKEGCLEEARNPTGNDTHITDFNLAFYDELESGVVTPYITDMIDTSLRRERPLTVSEAVHHNLRVFQHYAIKNHNEEYPHRFNRKRHRQHIREVASNYPDELEYMLLTTRTMSNISERGVTIDCLANIYSDRLGSQPNVLEVGCSLMGVLTRCKMSDVYPFQGIHVVRTGRDGNTEADREYTSRLNRARALGNIIAGGTGIDVEFIADPLTRAYTRACSFYPRELMDLQKVAMFDDLANARLRIFPQHSRGSRHELIFNDSAEDKTPEINFFFADFSDDLMMEPFSENPIQKFEIVFINTSAHQNSDAGISAMISRALDLTTENGLVVIQDNGYIDTGMPYGLRILKPKFFKIPFAYGVFVIDKLTVDPANEEDVQAQELWRYENARCQRLRFGEGKIVSDGVMKSVKQVISSRSTR